MKKLFYSLIALLVTATAMAAPTGKSVITDVLEQRIATTTTTEMIRVNIALKQQYDNEALRSMTRNLPREEQRRLVVNELKAFSEETQLPLLKTLQMYESIGKISNINRLWIVNLINCYATPEVIAELSLRNDIWHIDYDYERLMIDPESWASSEPITNPEGLLEITWNVSKVNAPQVWALGFKGEGIVVSVLDTGVNYNHNDIKNNMWTHPDYPFHGWNYVSNNNNPMDDHGHGTHCAGTVAGDGTSGSETGMAPKAKIMAMKILNSQGGGVPSFVWNGIEFSVDNGAHILSLSLGWTNASSAERQTWRATFDNALAAGVISAVAAGNEGNLQFIYPIPNNVRTPGNVPPPWLHPDQTLIGGTSGVMSVGATNSNDGLAAFSGRGPVTWQAVPTYNDYAYNPGIGLIRPDIVAPGDNVKSLIHTNNNGYTSMSGTSMATPGVAGVMALLLSKNANVTPAQMCQILEETALVLTPGKNNNTGSGRIDALAAINAVSFPGPEYYSHVIDDSQGNNNGMANPGELVHLTIYMKNESPGVVNNVTVQISSASPYIQIVDNSAYYGNFGPGQTLSVENGFTIQMAGNTPDSQRIDFDVISTDGVSEWESTFFISSASPDLMLKKLAFNDFDGNLNSIPEPGESGHVYISTYNRGAFEAENIVGTLSSNSPYIIVEQHEVLFDLIAVADSADARFSISIHPEAPAGERVVLTYTVDYGEFSVAREYVMHISAITEDFETGDFKRFGWSSRGHALWQVIEQGSLPIINGSFAARSGSVQNMQRSELTLVYNVMMADSVSFHYFVSSEENGDHLRFSINNELVGQWSGETGWQQAAFYVTPGLYTFKWEYAKNQFLTSGSDLAMIDLVMLPPGEQTLVFAGADIESCEGKQVQLEGMAHHFTHSQWLSSGDGSFSSTNSLITTYTPGTLDLTNGNVELTLRTHGPENIMWHSLQLDLIPAPSVTAGQDVQICAGEVLTLEAASAANYNQLIWSGTGSGSFGDINALHTWYMPSEQDIANGTVELSLTAVGMSNCEDAVDHFTLQILALPTATMAGEAVICLGEAAEFEILLTGAGPWEVVLGNNDVLTISESPYIFTVQPAQSIEYSLLSVSDINCSNAAGGSAAVTVNLLPETPAMPSGPAEVDFAFNPTSSFQAVAAPLAAGYNWQMEPENAGTLTADGLTATINWNEQYEGQVSIYITAYNDCGNTQPSPAKTLTLKNTTGIPGFSTQVAMNIFPNPSSGIFTLEIESLNRMNAGITVYNLIGQSVYSETDLTIENSLTKTLDLSHLDVGIYILSLSNESGVVHKRIVIK